MRDAARSGNKRWALSNWDLRWKVTAVLAVPLLVSVVLGASRIAAQFSDSSQLNTSVTQVSAIPAVTGLSAASAVVSGEQMVEIGPGQSLVQDADLTQLDGAIQAAQKAAPRLDGVPGGRSAIDGMITGAQAVRAGGKNPTPTVQDALNQEEAIRQSSVRTTEAITATISDPGVDAAKQRLVDSLNTRAVMVSEAAGLAEALRGDPKGGVQDLLIAENTERQMLNILSHRFPDGDPTIAQLTSWVTKRIQLTTGSQVAAGQIPIQDLRQSVLDSLNVYQTVVNKASSDIISRVNVLADNARTGAIRYAAIVIVTIMAALMLAVVIARSMIVPLRRLRLAALRVAEYDLGHEVARLRDGASPEEVPLEPMPVPTDEEVGQLARAVDDIHGQALRLAADQASMRSQVNDMFETLARRSKSLVDHQLSLIEAMEYDEKDPRLLENLFRLDHLAARMRRNGDNLLILAGTRQRRGKSAPVEIADVLRAAISEVEDYERVKLGATPRGAITEPAASDLAHLFAELLDNALRASPPETDVKFTFAQAHDQGLLVEVADRGIGMPPAEMADINRRLETTAEVGPDTARHMGLFVVGRLAERHGLTVRLRATFDTARDPGVTVTVHLPKPIIVPPVGGTMSVPTQANLQSITPAKPRPTAAADQSGLAASMQTRAVTRTPSGNMMVTVDPGAGGQVAAGADDHIAAVDDGVAGGLLGAAGGVAGGVAANGLLDAPSRGDQSGADSGDRIGGLPRRQPGTSVQGGLPQRQPGTNGPTVRQSVAPRGDGLPQREPGANGPQAPAAQPGANLPQRPAAAGGLQPQASLAANMLKRQPGAAGQPPRPGPGGPGGLPQRQRGGSGGNGLGGNGLPQRDPGAGGIPPRDAGSGGLPQRGPGGPGLPERPPTNPNLPLRETGGSGLPERPPTNPGLPLREPGANGLPQRGAGGLPQRGGAGNGLPPRDPSGGLPQRDSQAGGLPQRDPASNGLPQRDTRASEADGRDSGGNGLPKRQPGANGLPQRGLGGLPQRDAGGNGLPARDALGNGLPQRDTGSGLPQRDTGGNLPQRDSSGGLPRRDPLSDGLPQREPSSGGLPQRDPLAGGRSKRDPLTGDLPSREPSGNGLPQRDSSGGLPKREVTGTGLPQRDAGGGLPQRDTGDTALPQRDSGLGGLPRRQPGAGLPPRPLPTPGLSLPRSEERQTDPADLSEDSGDGRERGRHSFRSNPQKTAAFFQTRLQPAEETPASMADSPIFAEMMSAWLSDPNSDRSQMAAAFESPGDEGWEAARRAIETPSEKRTESGLPQRDPGNRLVPGGVHAKADRTPAGGRGRDPESIRSSLSRHQQGVRDGRAMKAMNLTGDKGDR